MIEFLLLKLKFREQPPRFVDANPDTAVTTQVHEGIIECGNLEKVTLILKSSDNRISIYIIFFLNTRVEQSYLSIPLTESAA